jgi:hypothetical protein
MRSTACTDVVATITALTGTNVDLTPDDQIHDDLQALLPALHQLNAHVATLTAAFDRRDLARRDGHRNTRDWLCAYTRISPHSATTHLRRGELLHDLPALGQALRRGTLTTDHLRPIAELARHVGVNRLTTVDTVLADLASTTTPTHVALACHRIREHLDPDGPRPDPDAGTRRSLTVSRSGSLFSLHGRLDLDGGAALLTALDAMMTPPTPHDDRTAAQRRADALTTLCTQALTHATVPTTGGQRPHLGLLITPDALLHQPNTHPAAAPEPATRPTPTTKAEPDIPPETQSRPDTQSQPETQSRPETQTDGRAVNDGGTVNGGTVNGGTVNDGTVNDGGAVNDGTVNHGGAVNDGGAIEDGGTADEGGDAATEDDDDHCPTAPAGDPLSRAGIPPVPEPPWLNWAGHIPQPIAQRLACDCHIWRVILDPATGLPLEVGRTHRIVPHWIRKALHARDRGCRWPGCLAHPNWTDAHHLIEWYYGGETNIDNLLLLCRYHHTKVHEGQWKLSLDPTTGEVRITRPDGTPYELGPSQPWRPQPDQRRAATHWKTGEGRAA